jgi:hypothetical protein
MSATPAERKERLYQKISELMEDRAKLEEWQKKQYPNTKLERKTKAALKTYDYHIENLIFRW